MRIKKDKLKKNKQKKDKVKKEKLTFKRISEKRIRIPKIIRLATVGIILIILIFSIINANSAFNAAETTIKNYETLNYTHNGNFNYRVYLKNNTVYGGKEYLNPGEAKYFKKIIDHINASFTYTFYINKTAEIFGSYSLNSEIQTNQWTKKYTLIPATQINTTGTKLNIIEEFPIDYQFYENIIDEINQETGITASSPNLIYKFDINLNIKVEERTIVQFFTQSINVELGGNLIDISDVLSDTKRGANTETQKIFHRWKDLFHVNFRLNEYVKYLLQNYHLLIVPRTLQQIYPLQPYGYTEFDLLL